MFEDKSRYSVLFKAIAVAIVCLFCTNSLILANPDTLAPLAGNQDIYQEMLQEMQRRYDLHNDISIDPFIKSHLDNTVALFDLDAIRTSLNQVKREFPQIQKKLSSQRDDLDDEVIENLLSAYAYLNEILKEKRDITERDMVELNILVLIGKDFRQRLLYHNSIRGIENKFYKYIVHIWKWYKRHEKSIPWKRAAGMYVRILGRPQLFVEGNHRAGALVASFILLRSGKNPFILNTENAVEYFNLSSDIKFRGAGSHFSKLRFWKNEKKEMERFLEKYADGRYKKEVPVDMNGSPQKMPAAREQITMELLNKILGQALKAGIYDKLTIKIWSGYAKSRDQKAMLQEIRKTLPAKGYEIDFGNIGDEEKSLKELVDFAISRSGRQDNTVIILPSDHNYARDNLAELKKSHVIFMDYDSSSVNMESFFQIGGIIAVGVAYLNNNDPAFMKAYRLLTNDNKHPVVTVDELRRDPLCLKFLLAPVSIKDPDDLKHLNDRMRELLLAAA